MTDLLIEILPHGSFLMNENVLSLYKELRKYTKCLSTPQYDTTSCDKMHQSTKRCDKMRHMERYDTRL